MGDFWGDLNSWIDTHQAITVAVGVPLLTVIVTGLVTHLGNKSNLISQRKQRQLDRQIKLADFRQKWIDQLRDAISEIFSLFSYAGGTRDDINMRFDFLESNILLMLNPQDPNYEELNRAIHTLKSSMYDENSTREGQLKVIVDIAQKILKTEWDRLKLDLNEVERLERSL